MKSLTDSYELSNGVKIPCVGFGTWQMPDSEETVLAVRQALQAGYRHIDTAQGYDNETSVGQAVKESGLSREEVFVTSKLANSEHGYDKTMAAFEETMNKLNMDYLDLFLIHWPNPADFRSKWQETNAETWKAFEELYRDGRIRAIGISNFHPHHIEALLKTATVMPMVNQIRLCPGDTQDEVVDYCRQQNILLEAYSPLGAGDIFTVSQMQELADKYKKTVAQVALRWSLQRGYLPLPKSANPERMRENAEIFDFELAAKDVQTIADLKGCAGHAMDPDTVPF